MRHRKALIAVAAAALLLPATASAHVTLQPKEVPAGSFARLDVRVPNEMDDAATSKVEVQMPDGFLSASYEPVEGWSTKVKMKKLDEPVESHGSTISQQVDTITWTADDPDAAIQPGQFRDFGLSVGMPEGDGAGTALTFPALQTYDNGDVVRWIGEPDSDHPAPQVTLTAAADSEHGADEAAADAADAAGDSGGAPTWLAILGVVLGALGLIAGGAALSRRR